MQNEIPSDSDQWKFEQLLNSLQKYGVYLFKDRSGLEIHMHHMKGADCLPAPAPTSVTQTNQTQTAPLTDEDMLPKVSEDDLVGPFPYST